MEQTQPSQLAQYIPVLMLLVAAIGFAVGVLAISPLLGKSGKRTKAKDTAYECGKDPIGEGGARFSVRILSRGHVVHPVRHRGRLHVPVGGRLPANFGRYGTT